MLRLRKYHFVLTIIFAIFLTSCSLFQNHHTTNEAKREVASESWESYFDRPDILEVAPQEHTGLMSQWSELKRAHIEAVAMFLEMYPDRELYFLARDSELLYDVARLALKDEPERLSKIHLLNISRANMRAENVQKYLAQEGISNETLEAGKKVLFIDTGFSGTIPRVLKEYFSTKYHEQLKTHLLCSSNPEHPSTRSFLVWLNSEVINMSPGNMHGTIIGYEHMPRYTDRSSKFEYRQGQWHPVSTAINTSQDGQVSKDQAQKYMEDLKNYFENEDVQKIFKSRRSFWREVKATSKDKLSAFLKNILAEELEKEKKIILSAVLDLHEMDKSNLNLEEFGIKKLSFSSAGNSNKNELIKKFPEWKNVLEDPGSGISELFKNKDLTTLGKMIDTIKDTEITKIITMQAGMADSPFHRSIIEVLLSKKDPQTLQYLAWFTFSQPHTKDMTELIAATIKAAVELKHPGPLQHLAAHTFSQPHTKDMTELIAATIKAAVELKDPATFQYLAFVTFSEPHTKDMTELKNFVADFYKDYNFIKLGKSIEVYLNNLKPQTTKLETKDIKPFVAHKIDSVDNYVGQIIETNEQRKIKVISFIDQGKRGRVYKVEDIENKKFYALKVAIDQNPETLESFAKELTKNNLYKKYGAPHADILESTPNMILKEWIEGVRADEFFNKWEATGAATSAPELIALKEFVKNLASKGIYIGDLNAKNLIWSNNQWVIVDSGGIKEGLTHEMALSEYLLKIPVKMGKHLSPSCQDVLKLFFKP